MRLNGWKGRGHIPHSLSRCTTEWVYTYRTVAFGEKRILYTFTYSGASFIWAPTVWTILLMDIYLLEPNFYKINFLVNLEIYVLVFSVIINPEFDFLIKALTLLFDIYKQVELLDIQCRYTQSN